jgi:two-component system nitrate/nitrite response regulator NarL
VLVIGENLRCREIADRGDLPCDGIMSLADATEATLDDVLRRVVAGDMPMPAGLARELLTAGRGTLPRVAGQYTALTARESETLQLLAQGFSNKQIAKALGISSHGVKRLVGTLMLKLGAPNRTTAVITALNEGLV